MHKFFSSGRGGHYLKHNATDGDDRGDLQDTKGDLCAGGTAYRGHPPIH